MICIPQRMAGLFPMGELPRTPPEGKTKGAKLARVKAPASVKIFMYMREKREKKNKSILSVIGSKSGRQYS